MELLFGALTTIIIEIHKRYMNKVGEKLTEAILFLGIFILVLVWTVLTQTNIIAWETVMFIGKVITISVGTYELLIKRVLYPIISRIIPHHHPKK